jgi:subtilisin family serine protease
MKKPFANFLSFACVLVLLITIVISLPASSQGNASGQVIPGKFIVVLNQGVDPQSVVKEHGLSASALWKHAINGFAASASAEQLGRLHSDARVKSIEPDRLILLNPNEIKASHGGGGGGGSPPPPAPAQVIPTGVKRIAANQNAMGSYNGTGSKTISVVVAVIDTGICLTHPDLNVKNNVTFVFRTFNGNDDNGHGSHVSGIIGARDNAIGVVGVAPGTPLWAVKVLDSRGSGTLSQVISGINYVTQNAGTVKVANMSLGMQGSSSAGDTAINNSVAAGVTYCVAAGNSTESATQFWPASNPNVITVSAFADYNGSGPSAGSAPVPSGSVVNDPDDTFASYSDYGNPPVDVCAPGNDIYSTYANGTYATLTGTSMATPHATGSCALFIAYENSSGVATTPQSVKNALVYNGKLQNDPTFGLVQPSNDPGTEPILYAAVLQPAPPGYVAPQ